MTRFKVVHLTEYSYESPVTSSYGEVRLLPRQSVGQTCIDSGLFVEPNPTDRRERLDFWGNRVGYFHVDSQHTELRIRAESTVDVDRPYDGLSNSGSPDGGFSVNGMAMSGPTLFNAVSQVESLAGDARVEADSYLLGSPRTSFDHVVRDYAARSLGFDGPVLERIGHLMSRIHQDFVFAPDATQVTSTVADLFESGAGVCQDFAHLAVSSLRASGLPGRYVSGYLETDPPPGQAKLFGADVSHAWASALIPELGWVDFDPTNDQFINDRYITTAWGRDYGDVAPVAGVIYSDGGTTALKVSVDVSRVG